VVGLTLPRLHAEIPRVVASPQGEALLAEFLTQRARTNLPLPRLKGGGDSLQQIVAGMVNSRLNPECSNMSALAGGICIESASGRWGEEDQFDEGELTFSYVPELNGIFHIGQALQRLDLAVPGAAETVMAHLTQANEATLYPLALPSVVRDIAFDFRWCELDSSEIAPKIVDGKEDYSAADTAVRNYNLEVVGYSEEDKFLLPSALFAEMKGEFSYQVALAPERRVELTAQAFQQAGFSAERSNDLVRRLEVDIPALALRMKRMRKQNVVFDSTMGVLAAGVVLGTRERHALEVIDEAVNLRMQSESSDHLFRIATAPLARKLKAKTSYTYVNTGKRLDGVEIFTDYINLLGHMDQILVALSQ
jgi:PRTRC genetic system protein F